MLIEIPVLYRATVVPQGRRKEIDCLLQTEIPVRIASGSTSLALALNSAPSSGAPTRTEWLDHKDQLMGKFSDIVHAKHHFHGLPRSLTSDALLQHLRTPGVVSTDQPRGAPPRLGCYADNFEAMPFLSVDACRKGPATPAPDPNGHPNPALPIYLETEDFRSCVPAAPGRRDLAIAHAQRISRTAILDEASGDLLLPTTGPVILANTLRPTICSYLSPDKLCPHAYRAEDLDEAMAFSAELFRGLPVRPVRETLEIHRPGVCQWDAAGFSLASMAASFGMRRTGQNAKNTLHGMGLVGIAPHDNAHTLALRAVCNDRPTQWKLFRDVRMPSPEVVEIAQSVVQDVVRIQQQGIATGSNLYDHVDATAIWGMTKVLDRVEHSPRQVLAADAMQTPLPAAPALA